MVNALLVVLLLLVLDAITAAAETPSGRRRCDNAPSQLVRIGLTTDSPLTPAAREIVEAAWRTEGLTFDWRVLSVGTTLNELDLMILADESALRDAPPTALGAVRFVGGQPQKVVRVSTGAIAGWFRQRMIGARIWPSAATIEFGGEPARDMLRRALGYVVAHEIGHVLLASKDHASEGIMRARYVDVKELDAQAPQMTLDNRARERLRLRMAGLATCP